MAILEEVKTLIDVAESLSIADSDSYAFYSDILSSMHRDLSPRELLSLFSIHTLIQMYVNSLVTMILKRFSDPVRICSGDMVRGYGVSVPQLLWWRDHVMERGGEKILRVCLEAISYAGSLDREELLERDPISMLYEELVNRVLRYSSGEYYTPRWVIELMFERLRALGARFTNESILDPSCGSGRFLVHILRKKIADGAGPAPAYHEIFGLDINPLAVVMARARLLIAYKLLVGEDPPGSPSVLWGDFVSLSLYPHYLGIPDDLYRDLLDVVVRSTAKIMNIGGDKVSLVRSISSVHNAILDLFEGLLYKRIEDGFGDPCRSEDPVAVRICKEIHRSLAKYLRRDLALFIERNGKSLGIVTLSSTILGGFLRTLGLPKPRIAITNPPWLEINELPRNGWGRAVREYVRDEYVEKYRLPRQSIQKGDLSAIFLDLMLGFIRDRGYVGAVLPAGQSYSGSTTSHGAGKLLTYTVLEKWGCGGEILYLGDVFRHGVHASIAIVKKGGALEQDPVRDCEAFEKTG